MTTCHSPNHFRTVLHRKLLRQNHAVTGKSSWRSTVIFERVPLLVLLAWIAGCNCIGLEPYIGTRKRGLMVKLNNRTFAKTLSKLEKALALLILNPINQNKSQSLDSPIKRETSLQILGWNINRKVKKFTLFCEKSSENR